MQKVDCFGATEDDSSESGRDAIGAGNSDKDEYDAGPDGRGEKNKAGQGCPEAGNFRPNPCRPDAGEPGAGRSSGPGARGFGPPDCAYRTGIAASVARQRSKAERASKAGGTGAAVF